MYGAYIKFDGSVICRVDAAGQSACVELLSHDAIPLSYAKKFLALVPHVLRGGLKQSISVNSKPSKHLTVTKDEPDSLHTIPALRSRIRRFDFSTIQTFCSPQLLRALKDLKLAPLCVSCAYVIVLLTVNDSNVDGGRHDFLRRNRAWIVSSMGRTDVFYFQAERRVNYTVFSLFCEAIPSFC